jgi:uncharacterized protein YndB with AHSA1/START domain
MNKNLVAKTAVTVNATADKVWDALLNPVALKQFMFGADVISDWKPGATIVWKGEWQGKAYEDKGRIIDIKPKEKLQYTHFSPLSGQPDTPENYHTVTIELSGSESQTRVMLSQDNNPNEEAAEHSKKNWEMMLNGLKQYVEKRPS